MATKGFTVTIHGIADLDDQGDYEQLAKVLDEHMQQCMNKLEEELNGTDENATFPKKLLTKKDTKISNCRILGYSDDEYPEVMKD